MSSSRAGSEELAAGLDRFSFSTSWNWRNSPVGRTIIEEIVDLGFRKVELNYQISEEALATIRPMVERGEIEVPSLHNVFPKVPDSRFDTDSRLLGYADPELRKRAVELTVGTVRMASELGARVVVVHPGVLPPRSAAGTGTTGKDPGSGLRSRPGLGLWPDSGAGRYSESRPVEAYDTELKALYSRGLRRGDAEFDAVFREFIEYRDLCAEPELGRIIESLEEVAGFIVRENLDVRLGIENRPMCWQIPDFAQMRRILGALAGAPLGMWFDTGHGAMMRHLGFFDDREEARALLARLEGVHIHDVDGVDDHFAPYSREGLDGYLDLIEAAPIKVLELGKKNSREDVVQGAQRLARALADRRASGGGRDSTGRI